jgi:hypothetical protein
VVEIVLGACAVAAAAWVAGAWRILAKAGKPGWLALVPVYNLVALCRIAGKPGWWVALFAVPIVNIIIHLTLGIAIANAFGKRARFGLGLGVWPTQPLFFALLGFGGATYRGASG